MYTPFYLPEHLTQAWGLSLAQHPRLLKETYAQLWPDLFHVYKNTLHALSHENWPLATPPNKTDRRFDHDWWREHPYFRACSQSYLVLSRWFLKLAEETPLSSGLKKELLFYLNQTLNAYAPSNFPHTNPEILQLLQHEDPSALPARLQQFSEDWHRLGPQEFFLALTRPKGFSIGKNIATTKGEVVFRNHLCELIQYTPSQEKTYTTPLLIIPPWINKYYIFDLTEKKSFVKWARDQGFTVFILSWINPKEDLRHIGFSEYLQDGLFKATEVIKDIAHVPQVHAMGYCLGGNLLSLGAAQKKAQQANPFASVTFLTTIADFTKMEDLGLFLDPSKVSPVKHKVQEKGYMDGHDLALTFSFLRASNLIWSALVNKYFLGKDPFPLDFLYWNADPSSLPATMYVEFLEEFVQKNTLVKDEGIRLNGKSVSFTNIKTPTFVLACNGDHIAPWKSCFPLFQSAQKERMFVLSTSGHIGGVINPPAKNKYSYFHLEHLQKTLSTTDWMQKAIEAKGSWWPFWKKWILNKTSDAQSTPPRIGSSTYKPLGPAPGTYVSMPCKEAHPTKET